MFFDLLGLSILIFTFWQPKNVNASSWLARRSRPGACMIVSDPDGAEIWLNQKKTKWVTPALIQIPINQESLIELKKDKFVSTKAWIRSSHELSFYYKVLERIKLVLVTPEA